MNLDFKTVDTICYEASLNVVDGTTELDLSGVTFARPFGLIYLGMFARSIVRSGSGVSIILPDDPKVRAYFERQRFWERFGFDQDPEFVYFGSSTALDDIVDIGREQHIADEVARRVAEIIAANDIRVRTDTVEEAVSEIVDNFTQHAGVDHAAFMMQYYPRGHELELAIGDCGIGIRASLSENPTYAYLRDEPHEDALIKAFEQKVSRKREGGLGFTLISDLVVDDLGGSLSITTGDSWMVIDRDSAQTGEQSLNLSGVQVAITIPESAS